MDLLNPNSGNTGVPAVTAITKPFPTVKVEMKYYTCTSLHASMHRQDGKKLPFVNGFLMTDIKADQDYLDAEIDHGNPYVRPATEDEIHHAKMRMDPKGTMKQEVRSEIEAELRVELEAKIRAEIAGTAVTDASKLSGADAIRAKIGSVTSSGGATITPVSSADIAAGAAVTK